MGACHRGLALSGEIPERRASQGALNCSASCVLVMTGTAAGLSRCVAEFVPYWRRQPAAGALPIFMYSDL